MLCRDMLPREKALVQRYQHQPFVLLGVNADTTRERLREVQEKERLTWRSWWDGCPNSLLCPADFVQRPDGSSVQSWHENQEGSIGIISRQWNIQSLPTEFLLDPRGIIRYMRVGVPPSQELEEMIDELLSQVSTFANRSAVSLLKR